LKKEVSKENYATVLRFIRACDIEGPGEHRKIKYISTLKQIVFLMGGKDLTKATKEDIENVLIGIRKKSQIEETLHD
jgi:hypothetical protein